MMCLQQLNFLCKVGDIKSNRVFPKQIKILSMFREKKVELFITLVLVGFQLLSLILTLELCFILVSPKILNVQSEFALKTGQTLEVVVPFEAYPEPSVEVSFENVPLTAATPHTARIVDNTCLLKIPDVSRPGQCGVYNIKLQNPYGQDNIDITVDVHGKHIFIVLNFNNFPSRNILQLTHPLEWLSFVIEH